MDKRKNELLLKSVENVYNLTRILVNSKDKREKKALNWALDMALKGVKP